MVIIEGEEIAINSQKIMPHIQTPEIRYTLKGEKVIVYPFSLSIHGEGTIIIENELKNETGRTIARFDSTAILAEGSVAEGKKLWGFSRKPIKKISVGTKESKTGAHKCQSTRLKELCYLNVFQTYRGISDMIHPRELYNESAKQLI